MRNLLVLVLVTACASCASSQPRVCALSVVDMQQGEAADLVTVSRSGACDVYPVLLACPEAKKVAEDWNKLWSQWETCR